jgi:tripartite-type tricarboxylate transporter receptor subunit TctC
MKLHKRGSYSTLARNGRSERSARLPALNEEISMTTRRCLWIAAACFSAAAYGASGDNYPSKPVRIIVPFSPGGAADSVTRVVANKLTSYWGKQVLLDSRPGVPGIVVAANATPDGYTMLMGAGSAMVTGPLVRGNSGYAPEDFAPVTRLVAINPILTATPKIGVKTVKELIALAKGKPGQLNYSSSGLGHPNHLAMELLLSLTGTDMVHVPYKGGAPSVNELISGQVHVAFNAIPSVLGHLKSGRLVPLAVGGAKRDRTLPELPTIGETVKGFEYEIWYALFMPAATPPAIVNKVSVDTQKALREPDVIPLLHAQGTEPAPTTPLQLAQYIKEDTARWSRIIRERNLRIE